MKVQALRKAHDMPMFQRSKKGKEKAVLKLSILFFLSHTSSCLVNNFKKISIKQYGTLTKILTNFILNSHIVFTENATQSKQKTRKKFNELQIAKMNDLFKFLMTIKYFGNTFDVPTAYDSCIL